EDDGGRGGGGDAVDVGVEVRQERHQRLEDQVRRQVTQAVTDLLAYGKDLAVAAAAHASPAGCLVEWQSVPGRCPMMPRHADGTQVTATIGPEAYPKRGVEIRGHRTGVSDSSARAACGAGIAVFQGFLPPKERGPRRRRSAGWAAILTAVQQSERA